MLFVIYKNVSTVRRLAPQDRRIVFPDGTAASLCLRIAAPPDADRSAEFPCDLARTKRLCPATLGNPRANPIACALLQSRSFDRQYRPIFAVQVQIVAAHI